MKYDTRENGTEVILRPKNDPITEDQKWERKWFEEIWNKYTMLVHVNSGKFLPYCVRRRTARLQEGTIARGVNRI